ncbi:sensor histidine kinase [Limnothrix redekei]|uniref:ATP-binding protein n=1 Tax=Limnothrix redekei LRLZ20PSL1 TaxID=3112953 RepID=A0ABW7CA79_9CYAN
MSDKSLCPPVLHEPASSSLGLEATLADLPSYDCMVDVAVSGFALASWLARYPRVPGAIVIDRGRLEGVITRQQLLEFAIRPSGAAILEQPLQALWGYLERDCLTLPVELPIVQAMKRAVSRTIGLLTDPIVVQCAEGPRLLDTRALIVADWQIRGIETQARYERMQLQAIQNDKLASLGRLVDGVAHQILDPVGFIWGNLTHLGSYGEQLVQLVDAYRDWAEQSKQPIPWTITNLEESVDFDFLRDDLPLLLSSLRNGAERLKAIVSSLQNFCHLDDVYPHPTDLHQRLNSIVLLLQSRLSVQIEFVRNYGSLPPVCCYGSQIDRALMAVLVNAVDVLLERGTRAQLKAVTLSAAEQPYIEINTWVEQDATAHSWAVVSIADNGPGLTAIQRQQILENFQLDRHRVKETGLTATHHIITSRHGGQLDLLDRPSGGLEVVIRLPLA